MPLQHCMAEVYALRSEPSTHMCRAVYSRKSAADRILFLLARDDAPARSCESLAEVCEWLRPF